MHIALMDKNSRERKEMHMSTQVAKMRQPVKHTGLVLVFIALPVLLGLLGLVGTGISHAHQGAVPHGGQMAPVTDPNDPESGGGNMAASVGDIHSRSELRGTKILAILRRKLAPRSCTCSSGSSFSLNLRGKK